MDANWLISQTYYEPNTKPKQPYCLSSYRTIYHLIICYLFIYYWVVTNTFTFRCEVVKLRAVIPLFNVWILSRSGWSKRFKICVLAEIRHRYCLVSVTISWECTCGNVLQWNQFVTEYEGSWTYEYLSFGQVSVQQAERTTYSTLNAYSVLNAPPARLHGVVLA